MSFKTRSPLLDFDLIKAQQINIIGEEVTFIEQDDVKVVSFSHKTMCLFLITKFFLCVCENSWFCFSPTLWIFSRVHQQGFVKKYSSTYTLKPEIPATQRV